jgi:hypothetical protein
MCIDTVSDTVRLHSKHKPLLILQEERHLTDTGVHNRFGYVASQISGEQCHKNPLATYESDVP